MLNSSVTHPCQLIFVLSLITLSNIYNLEPAHPYIITQSYYQIRTKIVHTYLFVHINSKVSLVIQHQSTRVLKINILNKNLPLFPATAQANHIALVLPKTTCSIQYVLLQHSSQSGNVAF